MSELLVQTSVKLSPSTKIQLKEHDVAIDYLRSFIIVLVVLLHSALAYASFSIFNAARWTNSTTPVVDASRWPILDLLVVYLDTFMMSLMFLISGLFTFSALDRKGNQGFFVARLQRLGIPFIVGALVLAPLAFLPAYLKAFPPPPVPYLSTFFTSDGWPIGAPWFLWVLLAFNAVVVLVNWKAPTVLDKLRRQPTPPIILLATLVAFVPFSLLLPGSWLSLGPFDMQPARIVLYFAYFLMGLALGANPQWRSTVWPRRWAAWLALVVVPFIIYAWFSGDNVGPLPQLVSQMMLSISFALSCAGTALGLFGAFRKFVHRSYPVLDDLSANSFGIYLIHYPLVIWIQFVLLTVSGPAWIKFGTTFIGSLALSWGLSKLLRRIPTVRRIL